VAEKAHSNERRPPMKSNTSKTPRSEPAPKGRKEPVSKSSRTIFIVEDHPVFRQGMGQLINREKDLRICGQADNAEDALKAILRLKPDLVLVDITLPGRNGLELMKELRTVDRKVKLLVVSMHDEAMYADRAMRAGGDGYIMKQEDPEEIVAAIRDVLGGHIYLSEEVLANLPAKAGKHHSEVKTRRLDQLSDSELEMLELLGRGRSNLEIAKHLHLDEGEVAERCLTMRKKLNLKSDNELIRYSVCWVETGEA
jgi:DNA-binding NarL/FixJ family response regulator